MSFVHPSYLWALLGLLVPIAIHLWNKKEAKTIKVGSVQLLSESNSKQSSSIQLNEWWLLLLRILIIMVLTLVLAKPQWYSKVKNTTLTYIVEPKLSQDEDFMVALDGLRDGQEIRLLEKGFPIWEYDVNKVIVDEAPNYWTLASEMDALKTDSIVVFTNGYSKGLIGSRPETDHHINWVVIDSARTVEKPLIAYKKKDVIQLFSALSNSFHSEISSGNIRLGDDYSMNLEEDSLLVPKLNGIAKVPIIIKSPIEVTLFYTDSLVKDKKYIEAAFAALSMYLDRVIKVDSKSDSLMSENKNMDLTIWLSQKPAPISFQKLLLFKNDIIAKSLIEPSFENNIYFLTKQITSENAVKERLAENLLNILEVNKEVGALMSEVDIRSVTESDLQTNYSSNDDKQTQLASWTLSPYLWAILFILFIIERLVAYKRKQ